MDDDGTVFIYYASSDSREHVAVSNVERLLDYVNNTPEDGLRSATSVARLKRVIENNLKDNVGGNGQEQIKVEKKIRI
jgi:4-O-beta-D-mannosyl-D-glucose phosphorylase